MVQKVLAVASVTALVGVLAAAAAAGCSSEDDPPGKPSAADGTPLSGDAGPRGALEAGARPSCVPADPVDATSFPYTKARRSPGACTPDELDALSDFFGDAITSGEEPTITAWAAVVSDGCARCVFSDGQADTWTPILTKDDEVYDVNQGGCIEITSGREDCGRTYEQATACRLEACTRGCADTDGFEACLDDNDAVFHGPCEAAYAAMEEACGVNLATYEKACRSHTWTFEGPITVQCVTGGATDAGVGGGASDAAADVE